jgi:hypothetical protein
MSSSTSPHSPCAVDDAARAHALIAVVQRFRRAIERYTAATVAPAMPGFPRGACGYASKLLARYLEAQGLGPVTLMANGVRGARQIESHAWLEAGGLIVDITADQFPDAPGAFVVGRDSTFHRTFRGTTPFPYATLRWRDDAAERFARVYAEIVRHLEPARP